MKRRSLIYASWLAVVTVSAFVSLGPASDLPAERNTLTRANFSPTSWAADKNHSRIGFKTTVNRVDYNLTWGDLTETGGLVAGKDVRIDIELEMQESVPEP